MHITIGRLFLLPLFLLFGLGATTLAAPYDTFFPVPRMYVLGDSLSDQGNLYAATKAIGPTYGQPAIPAAGGSQLVCCMRYLSPPTTGDAVIHKRYQQWG